MEKSQPRHTYGRPECLPASIHIHDAAFLEKLAGPTRWFQQEGQRVRPGVILFLSLWLGLIIVIHSSIMVMHHVVKPFAMESIASAPPLDAGNQMLRWNNVIVGTAEAVTLWSFWHSAAP
jgi:hypothetical protein